MKHATVYTVAALAGSTLAADPANAACKKLTGYGGSNTSFTDAKVRAVYKLQAVSRRFGRGRLNFRRNGTVRFDCPGAADGYRYACAAYVSFCWSQRIIDPPRIPHQRSTFQQRLHQDLGRRVRSRLR